MLRELPVLPCSGPGSRVEGLSLQLRQRVCVCVCVCARACALNHFSCVQLFASLWTVVHQAPLSMGFSRQEYRSRLPCPPPGDIPNLGMELMSLISPG